MVRVGLFLCGVLCAVCACSNDESDTGSTQNEGGTTGNDGGGGSTAAMMGNGGNTGGNNSGGTLATGGAANYQVEDLFGKQWIRYAEVQKTAAPPTNFIEASAIGNVTASGDLPDGILIMRVEDYDPNDWIFYRIKINGEWRQNNFYDNMTPTFDVTAGDQSCATAQCHDAPFVTDTIFTLPSLRRFVTTGTVEQPGCNRGGNDPCDEADYQ